MRVERRLAAVMAADVVGYSRLMGVDEEGTVRRIKSLLQDVVRPAVTEHRGRVVKTMGDGFLVEFSSVIEAFQCAVRLQAEVWARAQGVAANEQIVMRIGINVGDIIIDDGDVFGDGVNIAARLEGLSPAGGICVSHRAYEDLRQLKVPFTDLGEQTLKNIALPIRAYCHVPPPPEPKPRVRARPKTAAPPPEPVPAEAPAPPPNPAAELAAHLKRRWPLAAGLAATLGALAAFGVGLLNKPAPAPPNPLAFVTHQIDQRPCSWLRVSDHSSVDGVEAYKLSGAASGQASAIVQSVLAAAKAQKVDVDQIITTDVAPLAPGQCAWIDNLRPLRYAGIPRFELRLDRMRRGITRAELIFNAEELGPAGALYGIEPSGAVQRIVGRADLAQLGPPAVIRRADGAYIVNIDIDRPGWNGIVFMDSKIPAPEGFLERTPQTAAERQRFADLAKAGGWRFELTWFEISR